MRTNYQHPVFLLLTLSLLSCTGLDDPALPADTAGQLRFQSFEIDPSRNYLLARFINESPYLLTSGRLRISLYRHESLPPGSFSLTEVSAAEMRTAGETAFQVEEFLIREPLAPGYSTEVYYELNLDQLRGRAWFSKEFVDLKGKIIRP